ncbi:MAG TPA: ComEC/Rec2 family competence protein [Acidobacteriaceae bacterium]|nr:ComEC/Rec2 family competence protein [Acidobacteriaceae bacterium]
MSLAAPTTETSPAMRPARGYRPAPLRATRRQFATEALSFATSPLLLAATAFALGIWDARYFLHLPSTLLLAALLGAALSLTAALRAPRVLLFPSALLWFAAGQFCASTAPVHPASAALFQLGDGLQRDVTGTLLAIHSPGEQAAKSMYRQQASPEQVQQVDLALDHVEEFTADRDWQTPVTGGLRLTIYAKSGESLPVVHCGERVQVAVRFHPPERYLDPGAWDYPAYLAQHGIAVLGSAEANRVQQAGPSSRPSVACLATAAQVWAANRLDKITGVSAGLHWLPQWLRLNAEDSSTLGAMLFGDRARLQHSTRNAFERTGSFHLLVVSGLHVTIVIGIIFWLARRLRMGQLPATLLAWALALPYAFLTGFAPPVQRALWLSAVYMGSRLLFRERAALNAIGIAAVGVLVLNPAALFDSSFQMTFLAVLVIAGVAAPLIESTLAPYVRGMRLPRQLPLDPFLQPKVTQLRVLLRMYVYALRPLVGTRWAWGLPFGVMRWILRLAEALVVATVVELAMVLPMAVYFHRITLVAMPANLLGLPVLAFLVPLALATFLLGCIHPALAAPTGSLTALLLHGISWLIHVFGTFSASNLRTPDPPFWSYPCFAGAWIVVLWMVRKPGLWRLTAIAAAFAGSLVVLWPQAPVYHPGDLEITALDVGQGDSLLVVTPDGHTLLVDAGGPIGGPGSGDSHFDVGEDVVSQYLWRRHIRRLDAVALTHAHSDHMGGMAAVIENFHPRVLWVGNNPLTPEYQALLALAAREKTPVRARLAGDRFVFGNVNVHVLAPQKGYRPGLLASNDDSLVMRLRYGRTAALLEGDAEAPVENRMVETEPLAAGLLKVGHHGSSTSTTPAFLAAVHPSFAVISVGRHNPFGHPRISVLHRLADAHVQVYRTDTLGLSSFLLDGQSIQVGEPEVR